MKLVRVGFELGLDRDGGGSAARDGREVSRVEGRCRTTGRCEVGGGGRCGELQELSLSSKVSFLRDLGGYIQMKELPLTLWLVGRAS